MSESTKTSDVEACIYAPASLVSFSGGLSGAVVGVGSTNVRQAIIPAAVVLAVLSAAASDRRGLLRKMSLTRISRVSSHLSC